MLLYREAASEDILSIVVCARARSLSRSTRNNIFYVVFHEIRED